MSKKAAIQLIVLSTFECLVEGKKQKFIPSDKTQSIPSDVAEEVIDRGLAKESAQVEEEKPASKKAKIDDNKDQVNI